MDDGEIACGGFVVTCCETSGAFELVEAPLDPVAQSVDEAVDWNLLLAICSAGNDRRAAACLCIVADVIGIVSPVRDQNPGGEQIPVDERVIPLVVGDFATGDLGSDRQAPAIGDQMYLGREATL